MTTKEEVQAIAFNRMAKHLIIALLCFCGDAYLSTMPWVSVAIWALASVSLMTVGYVGGVYRMADKLSK